LEQIAANASKSKQVTAVTSWRFCVQLAHTPTPPLAIGAYITQSQRNFLFSVMRAFTT